ncbi:MAG: hypothetical protein VKO64_06955 [Candidatus Sericytochromatia bacterium]|nr:hypothetical protein [Candidatus Sericytochromatia bacterium]
MQGLIRTAFVAVLMAAPGPAHATPNPAPSANLTSPTPQAQTPAPEPSVSVASGSVVASATPLPSAAIRAATVYESISLNPARDTATLIWTGAKPKWRLRRVAPDSVILDLEGSLTPGHVLIRSQTGSPIMKALAVQLSAKRSRVVMRVVPDMRMIARVQGKSLIVTFDRRALERFWKIYHQSTFRVGLPKVLPDGTLQVPVRSPLEPTVRVAHERPLHAWVEIPADGPIPAKAQQPTTDKLLPTGPYERLKMGQERWGTVRLTMGLRDPRSFQTVVRKSGKIWLVEISRTADRLPDAMATPSEPVPPTAAEPARTPEASGCACTCPPGSSASISPDVDWDPLSRTLGTLGRTGLFENYPEGGVADAAVRDINTFGFYARHAMAPWWSLEADVRAFETFTIADRLIPNSTHTRNDYSVQGAMLWDLQQGPVRESIGAGYGLRYITVTHSLTPIAKDFLFSDMQVFQGPFIRGDLSVRPWGPLRLYARGLVQPYTFVLVDPLVDGLPDVRRASGELGLEWMRDQYVLRLFQSWDHMWRGSVPFQQLNAAGISAGIRY